MSTTTTLGRSISWASSYGGFRGLTIGDNNEPAATCANIVLQTILGAPFTWPWNRGQVQFTTTLGQQDYTKSAPAFGFIEKASYQPIGVISNVSLTSNVATYTAANSFEAGEYATVTGLNTTALNITSQQVVSATSTTFTVSVTHGNIASTPDTGIALIVKNADGSSGLVEISQIRNILGSGSELSSPAMIATQIDDNAGNITFRLLPVPDGIYRINVNYQKKNLALMANSASTWAPIPDHYSYIYQPGFLALVMAYWGDARWATFSQKFVAALLGAAEGLSEDQRDVFQAGWLSMVTEQQVIGMKSQQGVQARGT